MTTALQSANKQSKKNKASTRNWPCAPFPVRSAKDHIQALAILDRLMPLNRPLKAERDFIDIMLPVVEAYEARHHAIDISKISPLELLRTLLDDNDMNAADLGRLFGNRSLGGAILRGERELSKSQIKILAERFALDAGAFL